MAPVGRNAVRWSGRGGGDALAREKLLVRSRSRGRHVHDHGAPQAEPGDQRVLELHEPNVRMDDLDPNGRLAQGAIEQAADENFILPISHDEIVHGKGSLLSKMPGDTWQKFANLRTLLGYMYTHPGKKLLFMGTELAMDREWDHDRSLDWHLAEDPMRKGLQNFMTDLGRLYLTEPARWEKDHQPEGFRWIDCQDWQQSVVVYVRSSGKSWMVVAFNLTPVPRFSYRIGVPQAPYYREEINSDSEWYGK